MDPELLKQLQQLLAQLLANAQDAAAWAKGEIPLLVQEKIAFGRAWETAPVGRGIRMDDLCGDEDRPMGKKNIR